MSNLRNMTVAGFTLLVAWTTASCGTTAPTVTPAPENTPLPTLTPTKSPPSTPTMKGRVDVGGYELPYQCYGEGSPTVIVEAALGDHPTVSSSWSAVVQEVQTTTRICIYDRASGVRTSQDVAEDLHTLLGKIPLTGPYILVAHSLGGYHVRVFAHLYPQEVAGMILVDTTHPDPMEEYATAYPTYTPGELPIITKTRNEMETPMSPASYDGLDFVVSSEQVRQAGSLGDIPLIVISQSANPENWAMPGFDPDDKERFAAAWQRLQADLATLSTNSEFMTAKNSDHMIPQREPEIIIAAIIRMVEEIRNQ